MALNRSTSNPGVARVEGHYQLEQQVSRLQATAEKSGETNPAGSSAKFNGYGVATATRCKYDRFAMLICCLAAVTARGLPIAAGFAMASTTQGNSTGIPRWRIKEPGHEPGTVMFEVRDADQYEGADQYEKPQFAAPQGVGDEVRSCVLRIAVTPSASSECLYSICSPDHDRRSPSAPTEAADHHWTYLGELSGVHVGTNTLSNLDDNLCAYSLDLICCGVVTSRL